MRKLFQKILIIVIFAITGHIFVINIQHIVYLETKTYTYNFKKGVEIISVKETIENIKENTDKIDKLENSYLSKEELTKIKIYFNDLYNNIVKSKVLTYSKKNNIMDQKGMYKLIEDTNNIQILGNIDVYRTIAKYNNELNIKKFIEYNYLLLVSNANISESLINNYQYSGNNIYVNVVNLGANSVMNLFLMKLNTVEYLTNLVIESGDING